MNESQKFIIRICCEPQIKLVDDNEITSFISKITIMRAKKIDEGVIGQLRDLMREKGINELYVIDESKFLEMVKKSQAFDIIKEKRVVIDDFITCNELWIYNQFKPKWKQLTQEEYDLLKEVRVCH